MKRIAHKTAYNLIGGILMIVGFAGLVLPVIPGIVLLALGMYFLSLASLRIWNRIESVKVRYPAVGRYLDKFDTMIGKVLSKAH